jgi:quinol-cytochrome oxidoreductase complex cytochrome b subunit
MVKQKRNNQSRTSWIIVLLYLFLSIFAALVFSILYRRSVNKGNKGIVWIVLAVLCALFYCTIALSLVVTSSPNFDAGYYWLGVITLFLNSLAIFLILSKRKQNEPNESLK